MKQQKHLTVKDAKKVGALMRSIRQEKKVSATEVAEKMKISKASYSRIENGLKIPHLRNLIKFCNANDIEIVLLQK